MKSKKRKGARGTESKGQTQKKIFQEQKKIRKAVVTITPDSECKIDAQTGSVSDIEMLGFLRDLTTHFAQVILKDAEEVVGDDPEKKEEYINWRLKQSGWNN